MLDLLQSGVREEVEFLLISSAELIWSHLGVVVARRSGTESVKFV